MNPDYSIFRIYRMQGKYHELLGCVHAITEEQAKEKALRGEWALPIRVPSELTDTQVIVKG